MKNSLLTTERLGGGCRSNERMYDEGGKASAHDLVVLL